MPKQDYTPAEDALLIACYQAGWTHAQTSAEMGRTTNSLKARMQTLAELGRVQLRPRRFPPPPAVGLTAEDDAWMRYWQQPRGARSGSAEEPRQGSARRL